MVLQKGDILTFGHKKMEVLAVLEGLTFTRDLTDDIVGPIQGPLLIEDLKTFGWKKESE